MQVFKGIECYIADFLMQSNLFLVAMSSEIGLRRMRLSVRLWSSSGCLLHWVMRYAAMNSSLFYRHKIYFKRPLTRRALGKLPFLGNVRWPQKLSLVPVHVQCYLCTQIYFFFPHPSQEDRFLMLCTVWVLTWLPSSLGSPASWKLRNFDAPMESLTRSSRFGSWGGRQIIRKPASHGTC